MESTDFVYVSYIRSTPGRVWQALTQPEFTRRYWDGWTFESDWKPGSTVAWVNGDLRVDDPKQIIVESDPYHTLAYTWHTTTPEFAAKYNFPDELAEKLRTEPRSTVTFSLEPQGELVKLTVTHTGFPAGSIVRTQVANGWPGVISALKSLLETGEVADYKKTAGADAVRAQR